jgi:4-diphosphocytidyl-2-C-methyl-D-erythritol kinase
MVRGRGEVLEQRTIEGLPGTSMLLVNPGVPLSTARVFAGWDRCDRGPLSAASLDQLISDGRNDLEQPAIAVEPVIAWLLDRLARCDGVLLSRMSGSGATCFALFADEQARASAASAIRLEYPDWWVMETETRAA